MLTRMRLVDQWREIERGLPERWQEARVELTLDDVGQLDRASALLGPAEPGRGRNGVRLSSFRGGGPAGTEGVRRLLGGLDRETISGRLELLEAKEEAETAAAVGRQLASAWQAALTTLPSDWSDLLAEIELRSTDHLDRTALLLAPLNPARVTERVAFRFRCARQFGYGASPQMTQRCLERCDEEQITGQVAIVRALSDTRPVATQGPVWYVGGKTV